MADFKVITPKRDIARELARKYSTMTHDELDVLEDILEPIKYGKGEMILSDGEQCMPAPVKNTSFFILSRFNYSYFLNLFIKNAQI